MPHRISNIVCRALLLAFFLVAPVHGAEKGWSLRELPLLEPLAEQPATAKDSEQIRGLIKSLAQIDAPDVGYSNTMAGDAFTPLSALDHWSGWTMAPHNFKRSESLKQLVAFGPRALPFLLESLNDKTPTRLIIRPPFFTEQGGDGGMEPGREIGCNPMNLEEARALKRANIPQSAYYSIGSGTQELKDLHKEHIKDFRYTVTVGDICFVALGQITNRPYQAARYQSTGFVIVNSPAHDVKLAGAVRALWTGKAHRQQLFASLLTDFHTRGSDGKRGGSDRFQIGAAIRLLYYFPTESGPIVAKRVRELDVTTDKLLDSDNGHDANGIWAEELLAALTFSSHKEVRRELLEVFRRTVRSPIALAALPAIPKERNPEVLAKLKLFLKSLPKSEETWHGEGHDLLKAGGERFPDESAEVFREYLKAGSAQRRLTVCQVLQEKWGGRLAVELLTPLLRDRTKACKETYSLKPDEDVRKLPLRICDAAAQTIGEHRKDIPFKLEGSHKDLDEQIQRMRKKLLDGAN